MKTINRLAERMGRSDIAVVADDKQGPSELLVCPLSGDVEVWLEGKCLYKAQAEEPCLVLQDTVYRRACRIARRADKNA